MKLIRMTKTPKEYNGIPYNEYTLYCRDGNFNRMVTCTGKISVVLVDPDTYSELDVGKLDECFDTLIPNGSNVEFWFDLAGKISRIDVHCPANVAGSDTPTN